MSPRSMLGILAGLLLVVALFFGFTSPSVGDTSCGSAFTGLSDEAENADFPSLDDPTTERTSVVNACEDSIDDRKMPAFGALGLAIIALIVSFVASSDHRSKPDDKDTSWLGKMPPRDE